MRNGRLIAQIGPLRAVLESEVEETADRFGVASLEEVVKVVTDFWGKVCRKAFHAFNVSEAAIQFRLFKSAEEIHKAHADTAAWFSDGKPFSMVRWVTMICYLAESQKMAKEGALN